MHLQRVRVPDFRALKNVDIAFEQERIPQIFPLASQNGGGKSTLLQLVFVLLTCCGKKSMHHFLRNILKDFSGSGDYNSPRILAIIDLIDNDKKISLKFTCLQTSELINRYAQSELAEQSELFEESEFSKYIEGINQARESLKSLDKKIAITEDVSREQVRNIFDQLINAEKNNSIFSSASYLTEESKEFIKDFIQRKLQDRLIYGKRSLDSLGDDDFHEFWTAWKSELKNHHSRRKELSNHHIHIQEEYLVNQRVIDLIETGQNKYICSYCAEGQIEQSFFCQIISDNEDPDLLTKVSRNVFFASSGSQVFIMLDRSSINSLFLKRSPSEIGYEDRILEIQSDLPGFFLYDFSMIKILTEVFKSAIERDGRKAIQSRGQYGDEYAKLLDGLRGMFSGKSIEPLEDWSGIRVRTADGDVLYPEDLSHGELRRLAFYAWLKTKEIQDAIVLVDEIEIGLHPDWQYQIVKDLEDWAPSNQYILATHSYDVCSALTPAHVKEIEPKLTQKSTPSAN